MPHIAHSHITPNTVPPMSAVVSFPQTQTHIVTTKNAITDILKKDSPLNAPYGEYRSRLCELVGDNEDPEKQLKCNVPPYRTYKAILVDVCNAFYKMIDNQDKQLPFRMYTSAEQIDEQVMMQLISRLMRYKKDTKNFKYVRSKFPKYIRENIINFNSLLGRLVNHIDPILDVHMPLRTTEKNHINEDTHPVLVKNTKYAKPFIPAKDSNNDLEEIDDKQLPWYLRD